MQITVWKKTLHQRVCQVFEREENGQPDPESESEKTDLHAKIGELTVKLDFLEKIKTAWPVSGWLKLSGQEFRAWQKENLDLECNSKWLCLLPPS